MKRSIHVGVALGDGRAVAVMAGDRASCWSVPLPDDAVRAGGVVLEECFAALRAAAAASREVRVMLHVAVLWPLAECRPVTMPRLRRSDIPSAIAANVERFFPTAHSDDAIGHEVLQRSAGGSTILVAHASREVVEAIHRAVDAAGMRTYRVVPAEVAWGHGLDGESGTFSAGSVTTDIRVRQCRVVKIRRSRSAVAAQAAENRESVPCQDAWISAAIAAPRTSGPELLARNSAFQRRRRSNVLAAGMLAAAILVLAAAGLASMVAAHLELQTVRNQRIALADGVQRALEIRSTIHQLENVAGSFDRIAGDRIPVSGLLQHLPAHLPADAWVVEMSLANTQLTMTIETSDSRSLVESLRSNSSFNTFEVSTDGSSSLGGLRESVTIRAMVGNR